MATSTNTFIDTHIHVITKSFEDALISAGGDPSGYPMPTWTEQSCLQLMDDIRVQRALLSVTSPGPAIAGNGQEGRALARTLNDEVASIVARYPSRMSFFASTPDWTDVDGTLAELEYIFSIQKKAIGVVVMTSYGSRLLGDALFQPIWEKLNHYKAVVFIHPSSVTITPKYIAGSLPQPAIDYPYNTTRTAVDLLLTGRFQQCPDIDIILSHAGGSLPFLAARLTELMHHCSFSTSVSKITNEELESGLQRFYMDTALSTSPPQLEALLAFGVADRLIFGSDYPYAPVPVSVSFAKQLDEFIATNLKGEAIKAEVLTRNAVQLFRKHGIEI
ncbi:hypothetical protein BGZ49_007806 [Haplosporangium sp. Z 27]|nr:hypothetical protein BGZ49_007806 [Haplosporangium sp. Z 27]